MGTKAGFEVRPETSPQKLIVNMYIYILDNSSKINIIMKEIGSL